MSLPSVSHPWWKLRLSSYLFGMFMALGLILVQVPAQETLQISVPYQGISHVSRYEHGWPLTYLVRSIPDLADEDYDFVPDSCWKLTHHVQSFQMAALTADLLSSAAIFLAATALFEFWRRKRRSLWQFRLIDLLVAMTALAMLCGWFSYQHRAYLQEQQTIREIRAKNESAGLSYSGEIVYQHGGLTFLRELLGSEPFPFLDRVVVTDNVRYQPRRAGQFSHLKVLWLTEEFGPPEAEAVLQLRELEALYIILADVHHSAKNPQRTCVADLQPMPRLRSFCCPSEVPLEDVHWLANCPNLVELDLGASLTDRDIERWQGLKRIKVLSVVGSAEFTEQGMQSISNWSELEDLTLYAQLSADGLRHLENIKNLSHLHLRGYALDRSGIEELKRFHRLKVLMLDPAVATELQFMELRAALPSVEVIRPYGTF